MIGIPLIQTIEYEWLGENKKDVLLKVVVSNTKGGEQIQSIEYQDSYLSLSVEEQEIELDLYLVPNPAENKISIQSTLSIKKYQIFDITGKFIVEKSNIDSPNFEIDITELPLGTYFISLNADNSTKKIKFIKL